MLDMFKSKKAFLIVYKSEKYTGNMLLITEPNFKFIRRLNFAEIETARKKIADEIEVNPKDVVILNIIRLKNEVER